MPHPSATSRLLAVLSDARWAVKKEFQAQPDDSFVRLQQHFSTPPDGSMVYTVSSATLEMEAGQVHYLLLAICDEHQNCAMEASFPFAPDDTPPPVPYVLRADIERITSTDNGMTQHFVDANRIDVVWSVAKQVLSCVCRVVSLTLCLNSSCAYTSCTFQRMFPHVLSHSCAGAHCELGDL